MGILFKSLLFIFLSTQAIAEENVFSCSESGNLTHSFVKTDDGYKLHANFGMYMIQPAYNTETGEFEGQGEIAIDVPITNDDIRMTSVNWINEKVEFFKELFPTTKLPVQNSVDTGKVELSFSNKNCEVVEKDGFHAINCRAEGPLEINGVLLENVDFTMQNQIRTTLLNSAYGTPDLVISDVEAVYASLSFHKKRGFGTYVYRSSTTYYPNDSEVSCVKGDE